MCSLQALVCSLPQSPLHGYSKRRHTCIHVVVHVGLIATTFKACSKWLTTMYNAIHTCTHTHTTHHAHTHTRMCTHMHAYAHTHTQGREYDMQVKRKYSEWLIQLCVQNVNPTNVTRNVALQPNRGRPRLHYRLWI